MTLNEAKAIIGSDLSEPSKMPGYAFNLSAQDCITGAKLHEIPGTPCYKCYAWNRGNYAWERTKNAQHRRLQNLYHPQWVAAMVTLISWQDCLYFRWHDSGDLQSTEHLANIAEVARRLPQIKFWLPTREYGIIRTWFDAGNIRPKKLVIRLSANIMNGPLPLALAKKYNLRVSGVHTKENTRPIGKICDAKERDNYCGPCRACWDSRIMAISYPKH